MREWTSKGSGRCFYKATTGSNSDNSIHTHERESIRPPTIHAGCSYIDYGHVTLDFASLPFFHPGPPDMEDGRLNEFFERSNVFWDAVHYRPWVYEELNNVLLNILCNWKKQP
jgi:hypothetical protein